MTSLTAPSFAAGFTYDALGRRTGKTVQGITTNFLYDGLTPVQEKAGASITANILPGLGIDEYFTRTDSTGTKAVLPDALGSSVALTDSTGTLTTQYTYEPFGNTSVAGAATTSPFQYTGRENDGTGLYYYRARYYNPRLQRFISEDPIGFAGGDINLYAYASNNPVRFRDPSGLCSDPGGTGTRYCVQTFIPGDYAFTFNGDSRGASCSDGSYRSSQWIKSSGRSFSDVGTTTDIFGRSAKALPGSFTVTPLSGRKFVVRGEVTNGLMPDDAPSAWYNLTIAADANGGFSVTGWASGFPDIEVCQYGGSDGTKLVHFPHWGWNDPITGPPFLFVPRPVRGGVN